MYVHRKKDMLVKKKQDKTPQLVKTTKFTRNAIIASFYYAMEHLKQKKVRKFWQCLLFAILKTFRKMFKNIAYRTIQIPVRKTMPYIAGKIALKNHNMIEQEKTMFTL